MKFRPRAEALLQEARTPADPAERLVALNLLEDDLAVVLGTTRAHKRAAVAELRVRRPDLSWTEIGELIGVSGERARQIADDHRP